MKKRRYQWKFNVIEAANPVWEDLSSAVTGA